MTFKFVPSKNNVSKVAIPYIEDARSDYAPYYSMGGKKSVEAAQSEVAKEMTKLGGIITRFVEGVFKGDAERHGYEIHFIFDGAPGVIHAGLPARIKPDSTKLRNIQVQALLNVRDWLKANVTSIIFAPNSNILLQHLLVDDTHTVADVIQQKGKFMLPGGSDVVDGQFEEM